MKDQIVFLDTETTGLDPERHEVWEIGLIVPKDNGWEEHQVFLPVHNLAKADPTALRIGKFYERREDLSDYDCWWSVDSKIGDPMSVTDAAKKFCQLTANKHIVGAIPSFDTEFLSRWLRLQFQSPAWHYHLVDIEAMIAGQGYAEPPWDSNKLSLAVGVDPTKFDRHTALGDARWVKTMYEAVLDKG